MRPPTLLLLLAIGCDRRVELLDCPSFNDLAITNPDGLALPGAFQEVRAAVEQFATWNGGDGVCVGEVRLVDELGTRNVFADALFPGRTIEVPYAMQQGLAGPTRHGLCLAIDEQLGGFSASRRDWFPGEDPRAAFARVCERGPVDLGLMRGLEATCGGDYGAARQAWMNDTVYGEAELAHREPAGSVPITLDRREIRGLPDPFERAAASGATAVFVPADERGDNTVLLRSVVIDPASAVVTAIVEGPVVNPGIDALLPSDSAPLAVHLGVAGALAWRVEASGYVEVPFGLPVSEGSLSGVVVGDTAYLVVTGSQGGPSTFWQVDLVTGAATRVPWPDGIAGLRQVEAHGDTILGYSTDEGGVWRWVSWDRVSGNWTVERYPVPSGLFTRIGLADGRLLTAWSDPHLLGGGFEGVAVVDPMTNEWWLADQACDADRLGGSFELLSVAGEVWLWEASNGWSPEDPLFGSDDLLARVDVGLP